MRLLSQVFSKLARFRYPHMCQWREQVWDCQQNLLMDLLRRAEQSDFGIKYGFSSIFSVREFIERVPITPYEEFYPYVQQIIEGQKHVSWDEPIEWMAKSSGTTSARSKFIPVSASSLKENHYKVAKELLFNYYYRYEDAAILSGKMLVLGGSHQVASMNENLQYGDLSAVLMQNEPILGRYLRVPELHIALMDEWEQKIECLAQATMNEPITAFAGVPTWSLVLLRRILELKGASCIAEVWPKLELYLHGGVNFDPYRQNFAKIIGKSIRYLDVYNASEGFFAFQDTDESGMALMLEHGIFYEFLPLSELHNKRQYTLLLPEVELGVPYALVISTAGGLWRYLVGDVIEFTNLEPHRIKVTGRTRQFINAFGEEVIVENADCAITQACNATNALLRDYTVAPIYFNLENRGAAHEWLVEFERPPNDINNFTRILDHTLQEVNSDYEAKRYRDTALGFPLLQVLPSGSFATWLKAKGKLGGQHKVPRLCNTREYVEELKALISQN